MRTLGLIGGTSWESTATYYRHLNQLVRDRLGGLHSARLALWSFDFDTIVQHELSDDWESVEKLMIDAARKLERAGADGIVICSNTLHRMADPMQAAISIPILHIVDAIAHAVRTAGCVRPALISTRYTMEQSFYTGRLRSRHGIDVVLPDAAGRQFIHRVLFDELCCGIVRKESKAAYLQEIAKLREKSADGVILGCTEFNMLIEPEDIAGFPVFESTRIHAEAVISFALDDHLLTT
jgi:aspartate racemase